MERSVTSLRCEVARRQAITPFICSTFKDFAQERDHLANTVFPKLDVLCQARGIRFLPVDLRWRSEQAKSSTPNSSLVLQQCFDAIEQCSPYFICLLGERYGAHRPPNSLHDNEEVELATAQWMQKNFEMAAVCGNEWLLDDENKHCSMTELEIIKASFRERTEHGYFYYRDPEHIREQGLGQDVSQRALLMDIYESESEFAETKIKQLKHQIIDTGLPVKYFKSTQELGALVIKDWVTVLNSVYPAIEKKIFYTTTGEDFRECSSHETFAETRRRVFVTTQFTRVTCDVLTRHAHFIARSENKSSSSSLTSINEGTFLTSVAGTEGFPSIVALIGERGCGMTAILANWIAKFAQENPSAVVISHHTESGQRSADVTSFMRRCTRQLTLQYRASQSVDEPEFLGLTDFETITQAFHASLALGPCVIILDGLSHLSSSQTVPAHVVKQLAWLPRNLPPSCRLIVSTTRSDISSKHLSRRDDVHVIEVPSLQGNDDKSRILHAWLGRHARYLDSRDQASILAGKLGGRPLYYVALANEIRLQGSARVSEKQLDIYARARSFSDFWTAVIHRWSNDYSWLKPTSVKSGAPVKMQVSKDRLNNGWIPDALRLISVSRGGLGSDELARILRAFGYCREHAISPAAWRLFASAARHAVYVRADGLLNFLHSSMREAVDFLLLNGLTSPSHTRHVTAAENSWEVRKFQYHSVLTNSFAVFPCDERVVDELLWQQKVSGDAEGLRESLARPDVFATAWSNRRDLRKTSDFMSYWVFLTENGFDAVDTYVAMVTEAAKTVAIGDNRERCDSEDTSLDESLSIAQGISKKVGPARSYTSVEVAFLAYLAGRYFLVLQKLVPAESMLLKAFKFAYNATSIDDVDFLCKIQRSLGDLYYEGKLLDKAVVFYEGVLKTASEVTRYVNTDEVEFVSLQAHVYSRLAAISVRQILAAINPSTFTLNKSRQDHENEREDALALVPKVGDLLKETSRLTELAKLEKGKPSVYHTMGLLAFCEQRYDDAEMLLNRALDETEKWCGPSHPAIAVVLQDLARYHRHSDCESSDVERSENIYRRALKIREQNLGRTHLDVSETLVDLGCLLERKGTEDSREEARHMLERAVDIKTEKLGVYHERTKEVRRILVKL